MPPINESTGWSRIAAVLVRPAPAEVLIAAVALIILLVGQWMLSSALPDLNYRGLDGKLAQSVALTAFKFAGYLDVTNINPIQGIGSQMMPKNVWLNPSLWPFALFDREMATNLSALIALA